MTEHAFTAHPVDIAMGLRMAARHVLKGWDLATAHPTRLAEGADAAEALLMDARRLIGANQHDHEIVAGINRLRDAACARS